MMNLVMTGCVEDEVQGPESPHELGVDPELVEQVQLLVDQRLAGGDEEGQGKVERLVISTSEFFHHPFSFFLTTLPKLWKADCLRAVVRLYSSEEW